MSTTCAEPLDTGTLLDKYPFSMLHDKGGYTVELYGKTGHGMTLEQAADEVLLACGLIKKPEYPQRHEFQYEKQLQKREFSNAAATSRRA